MTHKNYILAIAIVCLIILLLIGGFIILGSDSGENDGKINSSNTTNSITQSIKEFKKIDIQTTGIKSNIKPQFKIGDKFEYEITMNQGGLVNSNGTEKFYVDRTERINGTDYYVIALLLESGTGRYYFVNKETGSVDNSIFRLVYSDGHIDEEEEGKEFITHLYMYAPWMLALKENLKFEMDLTETEKRPIKEEVSDEMLKLGYEPKVYFGSIATTKKYEFEVEGIEKIKVGNKERDCFKVVRIQKEGNKIVGNKVIMWVDVEKRILIKREDWFENLKLREINLVSEL